MYLQSLIYDIMKRIISTLLICSMLLTSCTTTHKVSLRDEFVKQYVGLHHNEIIRILGAPSREAQDGLGGIILVYEDLIIKTKGGTVYTKYYSAVDTASAVNKLYTNLCLDANGVCYDVLTNRTMIVKEENKEGTRALLFTTIVAVLAGIGALIGTTLTRHK